MTDEAIGSVEFESAEVARIINLDRWKTDPDADDISLFIEPCSGSTLDVGCGPGRLVAELTARQVMAVGIDVADDVVRLARERGAQAVRRDVFAEVPGEDHWQHVLLADGNIGIGGDPIALLTRVCELMAPDGHVIVEVAADGVGVVHETHRLQIDDRTTTPFPWTIVGLDAMDEFATKAGLSICEIRTAGVRQAVTLHKL